MYPLGQELYPVLRATVCGNYLRKTNCKTAKLQTQKWKKYLFYLYSLQNIMLLCWLLMIL